MNRSFAVATVVLIALSTCAVSAQAPKWTFGAGQQVEVFRTDRAPWSATLASAQRTWARASLSVSAGTADRGAGHEGFVAVDSYRTLARGLYVNAYASSAPGAVRVPRFAVGGELYAAPLAPWEFSGGIRHLAFAETDIVLGVASAARYDGPWLNRIRLTVSGKGQLAVSAVASARYYLKEGAGAGSQFVEGAAGQGQEAVVDTSGVELRQSWIIGGRWQQPVGDHLGVSIGAGYTADGTISRFNGDVGISVRL